MTELVIPLQANPNQRTSVLIGDQSVTVEVYTIEDGGMYANAYIGSTLIIADARCNAGIAINQYNTPLVGFLTWISLNGNSPTWETIGTNCFLMWSDYSLEDKLYTKFEVAQ